jgi:hypothetical protein
MRIPTHIPGVCGTRSNSTVCTETNFLQITGVCDGASQLRLCGGTAVSCRVSIFTWANRTCERETRAKRPLALGLVYLSHTDISGAPLAIRVRAQGADVKTAQFGRARPPTAERDNGLRCIRRVLIPYRVR